MCSNFCYQAWFSANRHAATIALPFELLCGQRTFPNGDRPGHADHEDIELCAAVYRHEAPTDGAHPQAGLVQDTNGNLYGTTGAFGANGYGTVFKITPSGTLTTLHSFDATDGAHPRAGLVQDTNGNLYGTTYAGGILADCVVISKGRIVSRGCGTIFELDTTGKETTLHNFDGTDGAFTEAVLVQDTNGNLYGTTGGGGANGYGTVFRLSVGLRPFVETQPTSGKVGAAVKILGTKLTGCD